MAERDRDRGRVLPVRDHHRAAARVHDLQSTAGDLDLRPRSASEVVEVRDGVGYVVGGERDQLPLWVRAIWFLLIGWWLGGIYISIAWFLCVILITLPIGLWLFNRIGAVMTLLRY